MKTIGIKLGLWVFKKFILPELEEVVKKSKNVIDDKVLTGIKKLLVAYENGEIKKIINS